MNADPTSFERMHDIVVPDPVPWWPPAPGWYAVIAFAVGGAVWCGWRLWRHWRANAYRRAALRELESSTTVRDVCELLRRTALAVVPRPVVASRIGSAWPEWLESRCETPMRDDVRRQLGGGAYAPAASTDDVTNLRAYAAQWIARHHVPPTEQAASSPAVSGG